MISNKIIAIGLMAVLAAAVVSTTSPAFSQVESEDEEEEEEREEEDTGEDEEEEGEKGKDKGKEKEKGVDKGKNKGKGKNKVTDESESKGSDEKVKAHNNVERKSKAIAIMKIALTSNSDTDSQGFGFAKLMLKIVGNKDPVLRAQINVVAEDVSRTLTACLNGEPIGDLTVSGSENKKKVTGHLKTTISNPSIQLPGITVDIVDGNCNGGMKILTGYI